MEFQTSGQNQLVVLKQEGQQKMSQFQNSVLNLEPLKFLRVGSRTHLRVLEEPSHGDPSEPSQAKSSNMENCPGRFPSMLFNPKPNEVVLTIRSGTFMETRGSRNMTGAVWSPADMKSVDVLQPEPLRITTSVIRNVAENNGAVR